MEKMDVVIVGAGLAGLATAYCLADEGLETRLIAEALAAGFATTLSPTTSGPRALPTSSHELFPPAFSGDVHPPTGQSVTWQPSIRFNNSRA